MAHVKQPKAIAENEARKLRTRQRLMGAAIDVIAEQGFAGCQIRDIVRRANVSIGTFYFYFHDKRDAFEQVLRENNDVLREYLDERMAGSGVQDLDGAFRVYYDGYFDFVMANRKLFLCWFRSGAYVDRSFGDFVERIVADSTADTKRRILFGVELGLSRDDLNFDVLARAVVAMLVELAHQYVLGNVDKELAVDTLVSFSLDGIRKRPPSPASIAEPGSAGS